MKLYSNFTEGVTEKFISVSVGTVFIMRMTVNSTFFKTAE